jgi:hypothetical protein
MKPLGLSHHLMDEVTNNVINMVIRQANDISTTSCELHSPSLGCMALSSTFLPYRVKLSPKGQHGPKV